MTGIDYDAVDAAAKNASIGAKYRAEKFAARHAGKIWHDYWIVGMKVLDAGGDDTRRNYRDEGQRWMNHEGEAINHVVGQFTDQIEKLAREVGITREDEHDFYSLGSDPSLTYDRVMEITTRLEKRMPDEQIKPFIMKKIGANELAYEILTLQKDAKDYVLMYDNWILVRQNNIEVYGYDLTKQRYLYSGLDIIRTKEAIAVPQNALELTFHDFKTGKSWYATEEDIGHPEIVARPQQLPSTTYNANFHLFNPKDTEENKYSTTQPSKPNKWDIEAKKAGIYNPVWRGTSEVTMNFKQYMAENARKP